jgi:hypothetical protein
LFSNHSAIGTRQSVVSFSVFKDPPGNASSEFAADSAACDPGESDPDPGAAEPGFPRALPSAKLTAKSSLPTFTCAIFREFLEISPRLFS